MTLRNLRLILTGSVLAAGAASASAQLFTAGDLVVTTYGSSTSTTMVDGQITPITLQEFALPTATSASLVLADQLPTTASGANVGIVGEYGSSSEGTIQLSGNGQYLTLGGYDPGAAANGIQAASNTVNSKSFAPGTQWNTSTIALAQSADSDVPRVAATIDMFGNVNTSTLLNDVYNANNPRSIYSPDGTTLYLSGQGAGKTDEGGLYTTTVGTNTTTGGAAPTPIFNVVSTRTVQAFNGNLYYSADQNSSSKGTQTGIFEYSGMPTTSQGSSTGTRLTPVSGTVNGTTVNFSPQGFAFVNATTMYVADTGDPKAGGTGDGGIQKWTLSGGVWTLKYTLTDPLFVAPSQAAKASDGETGFAQLAVKLDGSNVDIYAVSYTAGDADPNGLYAIQDDLSAVALPTGASAETFTELEEGSGLSNANGQDENLKGVAFAPTPEPASAGLLMIGAAGLLARRRRA